MPALLFFVASLFFLGCDSESTRISESSEATSDGGLAHGETVLADDADVPGSSAHDVSDAESSANLPMTDEMGRSGGTIDDFPPGEIVPHGAGQDEVALADIVIGGEPARGGATAEPNSQGGNMRQGEDEHGLATAGRSAETEITAGESGFEFSGANGLAGDVGDGDLWGLSTPAAGQVAGGIASGGAGGFDADDQPGGRELSEGFSESRGGQGGIATSTSTEYADSDGAEPAAGGMAALDENDGTLCAPFARRDEANECQCVPGYAWNEAATECERDGSHCPANAEPDLNGQCICLPGYAWNQTETMCEAQPLLCPQLPGQPPGFDTCLGLERELFEDDCEGLCANPVPFLGPMWLEGRVSFYADYTPSSGGQIPEGDSPLSYAYLCAYDQQEGWQDFLIYGRVENDTLLGCTRADRHGRWQMAVDSGSIQPDVYLVTWFCDGDDAGPRSEAETCIRLNVPEVDEERPQNRKYVWSRTYFNLRLSPFEARTVDWNVSCPNTPGLNGDVQCTQAEAARSGGVNGDENSHYGYTQEFAHAFRASVEPFKTFGTQKPNEGNTLTRTCTVETCQDEINLFVNAAWVRGLSPYDASGSCSEGMWLRGSNNNSRKYDIICLTTPMDAYRVVHEIGHNVFRRWLHFGGNLSGGADSINAGGPAADCSGWNSNADQKCGTSEGWADFFSSASWFNDDATNPLYSGRSIEDVATLRGCDPDTGAPLSEGHIAQFFWDLYDGQNHANEDDQVDLSFGRIRSVWSAFRDGTGNRADNERDNLSDFTGRNVRDYFHWYQRHYGDLDGAIATLMELNCMTQQDDD